MKVAVDLHIHTALSPCADNDMTPNNIVNMALLKKLDVIAITDHNAVENFPAVERCAQGKNIIVVPGMEVETREEVHLLCLFPDIQSASSMQEIVHNALPKIDNREEIFGQQVIMDEDDNITGYFKQLLITAADISIDEVFFAVERLSGVVVPAHVDRSAYSVISNLGLIPDYLNIKTLEISQKCNMDEFGKKIKSLEAYNFILSSDAHHLGDILERECFIELEELSIQNLISTLRNGFA